MSKKNHDRKAKSEKGASPRTNNGTPWSPVRKRVISILLLVHCVAVAAAPFSGPPPSSQMERDFASLFEPYLGAAYLGHGYRFFAPNPGPSHLVKFEVTKPDGKIETHWFPDKKVYWPRQLYHRYFMLAERVNEHVSLPTDAEFGQILADMRKMRDEMRAKGNSVVANFIDRDIDTEIRTHEERTKLRDMLLTDIAKHLLELHGGEKIVLYSVRHPIPRPEDIIAGKKLDDPESYISRPVLTYSKKQISAKNESLETLPLPNAN